MSSVILVTDRNTALTAVDGQMSPGTPIVLSHEGEYGLRAEATDAAGNIGFSNSINIEVTKYPRYQATAVTAESQVTEGPQGVMKIDTTILLAADEFDVKNI